jgi:hypothetical protein
MRTFLQLLSLLLLALTSIAIVCAVNAPRWMDGTPVQASPK